MPHFPSAPALRTVLQGQAKRRRSADTSMGHRRREQPPPAHGRIAAQGTRRASRDETQPLRSQHHPEFSPHPLITPPCASDKSLPASARLMWTKSWMAAGCTHSRSHRWTIPTVTILELQHPPPLYSPPPSPNSPPPHLHTEITILNTRVTQISRLWTGHHD